MNKANILTKTDYLLYLDSPMHLWAEKHDRLEEVEPSAFDQHLRAQGRAVQDCAQVYLRNKISQDYPDAQVHFEIELGDRHFFARLDAAVYYPDEHAWDIYEIKSGSSIRKEHLLDAAFQRLVALANFKVRDTYLLHLNKQYRREGEVELDALFVIEKVSGPIIELCEELKAGREAAWQTAKADSPDGIETCLKPKECPCPQLCHPNLPNHSIYNLPRIGSKAKTLRDAGITAIVDIPSDFNLTVIQARHADVVKAGMPVIDHDQLIAALDQMVFPLSFLDYETYNPAVPWYDGYAPHQHIVFQYSLHLFEALGSAPVHYEYLATEPEDPSLRLAADLLDKISPTGSVIVWNRSFEAGRNREMAVLHPQYAEGLHSANDRIFDLMEVFSKGYYLHPDFHGSASIKNVLPVLAPDLSYEELVISSGDAAMLAWAEMMSGEMDSVAYNQMRQHLLAYCKLDTWAMVRIWQALLKLVS
ncbi:MAG: DUF2779 domain-containing protein [Anaerolineales bacterium]|nr:DUF2779 domain-containing protein [Anaerolineales bacterium]